MAWLQQIKNAAQTLNSGDKAVITSLGSSGVALTITGVLQFVMAVVAAYSAWIARDYYKAKMIERKRSNKELERIAQERLDLEKANQNDKHTAS